MNMNRRPSGRADLGGQGSGFSGASRETPVALEGTDFLALKTRGLPPELVRKQKRVEGAGSGVSLCFLGQQRRTRK